MLLLTIIDRIITFAKMPPKQMLHLRTLSFDDICWFYRILGDKRIEKTVIPQPSNQQPPQEMKIHIHSWSMSTWYESKSAAERFRLPGFWFRTCALKKKHQHLTTVTILCFFFETVFKIQKLLEFTGGRFFSQKNPVWFTKRSLIHHPSRPDRLRCYHPTPRAWKAMAFVRFFLPGENTTVT